MKKIVSLFMLLVLFFSLCACGSKALNEDEQLAYQNTVTMKNRMRDPDSFKLYDEMFLLKHYKNGDNDYTYTIFKYGGTNVYGAIITKEAIFKDKDFIMNYSDNPEDVSSDYFERADMYGAKADILEAILTLGVEEENDTWKKVDIDIEKIKTLMNIH